MPRIFAYLAIGHLIVLIGTAAVGVAWPGDLAGRHVTLSVFLLLLSCLVQIVAFTYMTVTGKIIAQAVHLGGLDPAPIRESKGLKRSVGRLLGLLVVAVVLVTATGARQWRIEAGGNAHAPLLHLAAAIAAIVVHVYVFYHDFCVIAENAGLVGRTLASYRRSGKAASPSIQAERPGEA